MSRSKHLQWCKDRALEYISRGKLQNALTSMGNDLNKHPETKGHSGIYLGMSLFVAKQLETREEMEKFINGFN